MTKLASSETEFSIRHGLLHMVGQFYKLRKDPWCRQKLREFITAYRDIRKVKYIHLEY